jgi:hypothetical protein
VRVEKFRTEEAMSIVMTRTSRVAQAIAAGVFVTLGLALALLPKDWIEVVLGADSDRGDGSAELAMVLAPLAIGVAIAVRLAINVRADRRSTACLSPMGAVDDG